MQNMRLSQTVTSLLPMYENYAKHEKTAMTKKIVEEIKIGDTVSLDDDGTVLTTVSGCSANDALLGAGRTVVALLDGGEIAESSFVEFEDVSVPIDVALFGSSMVVAR